LVVLLDGFILVQVKKYMKRVLFLLIVLPLICQQPSTILPNGWLGGITVPISCSSGSSPAFYLYTTPSLWDCVGNTYVIRGAGTQGPPGPAGPAGASGILSIEGSVTPEQLHAAPILVPGVAGVTIRVVGVLFAAVGGDGVNGVSGCTDVMLSDTTGVVVAEVPAANLVTLVINTESSGNMILSNLLGSLTPNQGLQLSDVSGQCGNMADIVYRFLYKTLPN
jgi:hypothetical protein